MKKRFIVYGLMGWCIEVFWTGMCSLIYRDVTLASQTSLWMFPIYSLMVFIEPIYGLIKKQHIILRGCIYVICIYTVEYFSGLLLLSVFGSTPWDYSHAKYNINGLIRLDYAPAWLAAGLLFEKLQVKLKVILPSKKKRALSPENVSVIGLSGSENITLLEKEKQQSMR